MIIIQDSNHQDDLADNSSSSDRKNFTPFQTIEFIWNSLGLSPEALKHVRLEGEGYGLPSSFKVGHLAQSSIALSTLTAALFYSLRTSRPIPRISVSLSHACAEFKSEQLYRLGGTKTPDLWGPIGGLHRTSDGYVRIHDGFPHHRTGIKKLLGCPVDADRTDLASKALQWKSVELETAAMESNLAVVAALRSYAEWDAHPQSKAVADIPVIIRKVSLSPSCKPPSKQPLTKALSGIKVLEFSRVIAAPVCGRTLAAHGADVLWVTSPNLPSLPALDIDFSRGKRTIQLDLNDTTDKLALLSLAKDADVFIQSYRPGSLAAHDISPETLSRMNPNGMVVANLSAYGSSGPWANRRGFDSLVQTCSGLNVSEAAHFGDPDVSARPMPCQALDHASGYFLAAGVHAALHKRATEGGSYEVEVSLAAVAKYLRSLGQQRGRTGFEMGEGEAEDLEGVMETRESSFGMLTAVKHSGKMEGVDVGWDLMPKPLGSDEARWLE